MGKGWCHVSIPLTQGPIPHMDGCLALCKDGHQRMGHPNSQEKDMCWLESFVDRIGRSPSVLKAILFFKSFLLRGNPRAPCGIVVLFCEGQGTYQSPT